MAIKKSLLIAGAAASVGLASLSGVALVAAQSNTDPGTSLAQKIAQKFNLKESDVKAVIDEQHSEMEQQHKQRIDDKLTQAVKDGKITEDQKSKIIAKMDELQKDREANRDKFKDMNETERHTLMQQKRDELKQWAKDNNIPEGLLPMGGPGRGHGHGHPMMESNN